MNGLARPDVPRQSNARPALKRALCYNVIFVAKIAGSGVQGMDAFGTKMTDERIPVSLLTGFLGSGKTTVLNRLMRQPELANTLVVINEFGEIGLDHVLLETSSEDMVLLNSGCLCCTVRGDLIDTLRRAFLRRVRGEIPPFGRVIIETTGLADPAPVLHTLMTDPVLEARYRIDGVITTVDAVNGADTLDRQPESIKQAAVADRLLLTKTDLAAPEIVESLERRLRALNPAAPILTVVDGAAIEAAAAAGGLFNAGLYDPATKSPDVLRWLKEEAFAEPHGHHHHHHDEGGRGHGDHDHGGHGHDTHGHEGNPLSEHDHGHPLDVNRHDDHIRAFCMTIDDPIEPGALQLWLEMLLAVKGPDLLRLKAIVNLQGEDQPVVIHGVQHVFHPPIFLKAWPSEDRRSRFVFITRDISRAALEKLLIALNRARSGDAADDAASEARA